jgi:hypothetical protein
VGQAQAPPSKPANEVPAGSGAENKPPEPTLSAGEPYRERIESALVSVRREDLYYDSQLAVRRPRPPITATFRNSVNNLVPEHASAMLHWIRNESGHHIPLRIAAKDR